MTEVTYSLHPLLLIAVILIAQQIPSQLGGAVAGSYRSGRLIHIRSGGIAADTSTCRRGILVLATVALAGSFALTGIPVANADSLSPGQPVAPPGDDMGHVSISTEPGGIVHVNIIGRYDAVDSVGPFANGCTVFIGAHVEEKFVILDGTGSGAATFGPGETTGGWDGWCGSNKNPAKPTDLFAPHERVCMPETPDSYAGCSDTGTLVFIDGGPPVVAPHYPKPADIHAPQSQQASAPDCKKLADDVAAFPPGSIELLDTLTGELPGKVLAVALIGCGLDASVLSAISPNPNPDLNLQGGIGICKGIESLAPFDTAHNAVCGESAG